MALKEATQRLGCRVLTISVSEQGGWLFVSLLFRGFFDVFSTYRILLSE